jgi:hypothetical protein
MNVLSRHGRSQVKTRDRQFAVRIIEAHITPLWEIQRQCERSYILCRSLSVSMVASPDLG